MSINITGHNVEVTQPIKDYLSEKIERIKRHFPNQITSINVIFRVEKLDHTSEATIRIPHAEVHASSTSEDLYSAIDLMADKLDRQMKKHKEKS